MGLSSSEYGEQLLDLLPGGLAWNKGASSMLRKLTGALAGELARVDGRAGALRDEADPFFTLELLPDWERVLGLPDPCVTEPQSTEQRRAAVVARLAARGGQSRAFYLALAAALGYQIEVREFRPATCVSPCTAALTQSGAGWTYAWAVVAPLDTITVATCRSTCVDRLRTWGNERLECALRRVKPAHTVLLFIYEDPPEAPSNQRHLVLIYLDDPPPMAPWASELPWEEGEGIEYENRLPQTPNLDALCALGRIATRAKVAAVCSPGRASKHTGVYQHRHGLGTVCRADYNGDAAEFGDAGFQWPTIATKLKQNADVRLGFFGKLHLSNDRATEGGLGFELFAQRMGPWDEARFVRNNHNNPPFPSSGAPAGYYGFREKVLPSGEELDVVGEYSVPHWFNAARDFITSSPPGKRLCVFITQNTTHSPYDVPPAGTVTTEEYITQPPSIWTRQMQMTEAFDHYLGEFLASLPQDVVDKTTFVVCGDNGPDQFSMRSARTNAGKEFGEVWDALLDSAENGVERFKDSIFRFGDWAQLAWIGPGVQLPGTVTEAPLQMVDLHATLCDYFGVEAGAIDGVSALEHLHAGGAFPREHGVQFQAYFMPNGNWSTIAATGNVWSAGTNYTPDDLVDHLGAVYECVDPTGPAHGGPNEPGTPSGNGVWVIRAWADFSLEATILTNPGGPDFNGRFKLIRRLGYPDVVFHLRRLDGSPVNPYELPGQEWDEGDAPPGVVVTSFLQGLLEEILTTPAGPADTILMRSADETPGSVRQVPGGGFLIRAANGTGGTIPATDPPGDIAGEVRLDNAPDVVGALLLSVSVPVLGAVPITSAAGFPGSLELDELGGVPVVTAAAVLGSLAVGEDGVPIEDPSDTAGSLALI